MRNPAGIMWLLLRCRRLKIKSKAALSRLCDLCVHVMSEREHQEELLLLKDADIAANYERV